MDSLSGVTLIKADGSSHAAETALEGKVGPDNGDLNVEGALCLSQKC